MERVLQLRAFTDEEERKIERLARAQSAPVRLVRRARLIQLARQGLRAPEIGRDVGVSEQVVRHWLKRFAAAGMEGLEEAPRSGRPPTDSPEVTNQVIAKAQGMPPKPEDVEGAVPPTCHWTLDRLQAELAKDGVAIKRSQIRRLLKAEHLKAEHLKWQRPRTWLESRDPDFAPKRGPSSSSTPSRRRAAR